MSFNPSPKRASDTRADVAGMSRSKAARTSSSFESVEMTPWRNCKNLDEFAKAADLDKMRLDFLNPAAGAEFWPWLVREAEMYLASVRKLVQFQPAAPIQYIPIPVPAERHEQLVSIYVGLLRISPRFHIHDDSINSAYCKLLERWLPSTPKKPRIAKKATIAAFHRDPKDDRGIAWSVYQQILSKFQQYRSATHLAPYTPIVGPSGIGKSFTIQQMARQGLAYIDYSSFAQSNSTAYPSRSPIADTLEQLSTREDATIFFECHIGSSFVRIKQCRSLGITPLGLFELQVRPNYHVFQSRLARLVKKLYDTVKGAYAAENTTGVGRRERSGSGEGQPMKYRDFIAEYLEEYSDESIQVFEDARDEMLASGNFSHLLSKNIKDFPSEDGSQPSVLLCFDEARSLVDTNPPGQPMMRFLALRRALRRQSKSSRAEDALNFFSILLDTTSRVSSFVPPRKRDPGRKSVTADKVFEPIIQIDSIDIFVPPTPPKLGGTIDIKRLFSFGRPLWGSAIKAEGLQFAQALAHAKVCDGVRKDVEALALLSYRVNFYVVHHSLAEELTSGYLRYIIGINDDRTLLRTVQPSEPILAHTSAGLMRQLPRRLEMIKILYDNIVKGTIHLDDIGEIVSALILLFAFDNAHKGPLPGPLPFSEFISSLFPRDNFDTISLSMSTNKAMNPLWQDGCVFFNHFIRARTNPTLQTLRKAYERGAAIFAPFGYKGADIIVPVWLPANDFTYFIIQVKNRQDGHLTAGLRNEARSALESAAGILPRSSAHMAMLMSLRSKENKIEIVYSKTERPEQASSSGTQRQKKKNTKRRPTLPWKADGSNPKNRVVIAAAGLDLDVYPAIGCSTESSSNGNEGTEIVKVLTSLLNFSSEIITGSNDPYFTHLEVLN